MPESDSEYSDEEARRNQKANQEFVGELFSEAAAFEVEPIQSGKKFEGELETRKLRNARRLRRDDKVGRMTLTEVDGVMRWEMGGGISPTQRLMRRGPGRRGRVADEIVGTAKFEDLPPNEIGKQLIKLDEKLTPNQGLHEISKNTKEVLRSDATPINNGRILLLVHGTFSNCESMTRQLRETEEGRDWFDGLMHGIKEGTGPYQQVLAFNHPTLSTTPLVNAIHLASLLRSSQAHVDIIAHSRGGIVARWVREAMEMGSAQPGAGVLVGSPLGGTSLAAPAQLKNALDILTNYAKALRYAASATGVIIPFAAALTQAIGLLMRIIGSMLRMASRTPILDAGIGLVPGLLAQGREGANLEIRALREHYQALPDKHRAALNRSTYVIKSNFEPDDIGWRFWRAFRNPKQRLADIGADMIFPGENDLVVDSSSMVEMADATGIAGSSNVLDFGTNGTTHHTNYFQNPETIKFIRKVLSANS
eukprot:g14117.t1